MILDFGLWNDFVRARKIFNPIKITYLRGRVIDVVMKKKLNWHRVANALVKIRLEEEKLLPIYNSYVNKKIRLILFQKKVRLKPAQILKLSRLLFKKPQVKVIQQTDGEGLDSVQKKEKVSFNL